MVRKKLIGKRLGENPIEETNHELPGGFWGIGATRDVRTSFYCYAFSKHLLNL